MKPRNTVNKTPKLSPEKLERFTNWLLQQINNAPARAFRVRDVPPGVLAMTLHEVDEALRVLRDQDVIACTNGRWWVRNVGSHKVAGGSK